MTIAEKIWNKASETDCANVRTLHASDVRRLGLDAVEQIYADRQGVNGGHQVEDGGDIISLRLIAGTSLYSVVRVAAL